MFLIFLVSHLSSLQAGQVLDTLKQVTGSKVTIGACLLAAFFSVTQLDPASPTASMPGYDAVKSYIRKFNEKYGYLMYRVLHFLVLLLY